MDALIELKKIRNQISVLIYNLEHQEPEQPKAMVLTAAQVLNIPFEEPSDPEMPKISSVLKKRQKQYASCLKKLASPEVQAEPGKFEWYKRFKMLLEEVGVT